MEEVRDNSGEVKLSFFAKQKMISDAKTTFQLVAAVVKNATLYPKSHPSLLSSAEKLLGKIEELMLGRKDVSFYLVAGELFFETYSIPLDQSLWLIDSAGDFWAARRELLGESFNDFLRDSLRQRRLGSG